VTTRSEGEGMERRLLVIPEGEDGGDEGKRSGELVGLGWDDGGGGANEGQWDGGGSGYRDGAGDDQSDEGGQGGGRASDVERTGAPAGTTATATGRGPIARAGKPLGRSGVRRFRPGRGGVGRGRSG
jgi:hypothetical protein